VVPGRRTLSEHLALFVNLETGLLEVLDHPGSELLASIVRRVFLKDPAQQLPAARDREADREGELIAERAVIHQGRPVLVTPVIVRRRGCCQAADHGVKSIACPRGSTDKLKKNLTQRPSDGDGRNPAWAKASSQLTGA
jgi:hypothetical protein